MPVLYSCRFRFLEGGWRWRKSLRRASNSKRDCDAWSLLLLAATVRSFAHMPLGISDRNKMVLWPGCEGRAEFSLHTKNVRSVRFVVKRRGCCCNLSGGVALIVWFTTNGMCARNNTIIYVRRASNSKRDCDAWSLLLLAVTVRSFAHVLLGISDRNSVLQTRKQRKKLSAVTRRFAFWKIMDKVQTHVDYWITLYMAGLLNTLPS